VTIDGPAGAGKSSIARRVAEQLSFEFLDTGALYRAVTLGAIRAEINLQDPAALVEFVRGVDLQWRDSRVYLDGDDVTEQIRTPRVTEAIRYMADLPDVRVQLSRLQRQIAQGRDIVTEGRDQGTDVFPDALCKFFLTASPEERARRRQRLLSEMGQSLSIEEIQTAQDLRDTQDRDRPIGALCPADDAVVISSDGMTQEEVIDQVLKVVRSRS